MTKNNKHPNILCFIMDQLRYDYLGCMGNSQVKTPNIDALANSGVTFNRAYVANPLCMPARATLFTGQTPRSHGVRTNGIPLNKDILTLPQALSNAGYRTHSVGKIHLNNFGVPNDLYIEENNPYDFPERRQKWLSGEIKHLPEPYYGLQTTDFVGGHGFGVYGDYLNWLKKEYPEECQRISIEHPDNKPLNAPQTYKWSISEELHYNHWIGDQSIKFLEEEANNDSPFFLWCSFPDPHHPYAAPEPWSEMYDPKIIEIKERKEGELEELPPYFKSAYENKETLLSGLQGKAKVSEEELQEMIAITYSMISFVDDQIGRIMKKIDELGLREDTIVIILSDHGDMMGDHWMVRKGPFQFEGLLRIPFIWNWPGHFPESLKTEELVSQIDFAPTLLDLCNIPIPEGRVPKIVEAKKQVEPWPGKSLNLQLRGNTKKANNYIIVENDEDYLGLRIRTFITKRYKITIYPGKPYGQLYDLKNDPDELHNLWNVHEYNDIKDSLYKDFLESYILQDSALPRRMSHA